MIDDSDIKRLDDTECKICGTKYKYCSTCKEFKTIESWRQHTDTINCYKIFMIIIGYSDYSINKEEAKRMLTQCDLSNFDNFHSWIQYQINQINKD